MEVFPARISSCGLSPVSGLGFRVSGFQASCSHILRFGVEGFGFGVEGLGFRVQGLGFRV